MTTIYFIAAGPRKSYVELYKGVHTNSLHFLVKNGSKEWLCFIAKKTYPIKLAFEGSYFSSQTSYSRIYYELC